MGNTSGKELASLCRDDQTMLIKTLAEFHQRVASERAAASDAPCGVALQELLQDKQFSALLFASAKDGVIPWAAVVSFYAASTHLLVQPAEVKVGDEVFADNDIGNPNSYQQHGTVQRIAEGAASDARFAVKYSANGRVVVHTVQRLRVRAPPPAWFDLRAAVLCSQKELALRFFLDKDWHSWHGDWWQTGEEENVQDDDFDDYGECSGRMISGGTEYNQRSGHTGSLLADAVEAVAAREEACLKARATVEVGAPDDAASHAAAFAATAAAEADAQDILVHLLRQPRALELGLFAGALAAAGRCGCSWAMAAIWEEHRLNVSTQRVPAEGGALEQYCLAAGVCAVYLCYTATIAYTAVPWCMCVMCRLLVCVCGLHYLCTLALRCLRWRLPRLIALTVPLRRNVRTLRCLLLSLTHSLAHSLWLCCLAGLRMYTGYVSVHCAYARSAG
jgi:hypothetical protein